MTFPVCRTSDISTWLQHTPSVWFTIVLRNIHAVPAFFEQTADAIFLAETDSADRKALAKAISSIVSRLRSDKWTREEMGKNETKAQRITVFSALIDLVGRAYENRQPKEIAAHLAEWNSRSKSKPTSAERSSTPSALLEKTPWSLTCRPPALIRC